MVSHRVALVVPARDEQEFLPAVLAAVPEWVDDVIVVDDGSEDATAAVAAGWSDPRVQLQTLRPGRGVGAAILAGYATSLDAGADVVAVVGGDGQMNLDELADVVAPVVAGEADYVQGTRFPAGRLRGRMPWTRRLGNRLLARLTAWAARAPVSDSQCGYTAASGDFARALLHLSLPQGYGFPAFVRFHAHALRQRVQECPVSAIYGDEVSGIRPWRDPIRIVAQLAQLGVSHRLARRGLAVGGGPTSPRVSPAASPRAPRLPSARAAGGRSLRRAT